MTPEDPLDRANRQIEGLLTSYGALMRDQGVLGERIDGHGEQLVALHQEIRALPGKIERAVRVIDERCEKRHEEIKESIEEIEKKVGDERTRREWTVKERAMIYAAIVGPMATAAMLFLDKGPAG